MLFRTLYEDFELFNQVQQPDGQGGFTINYVSVKDVKGSIVTDSRYMDVESEKNKVEVTYTFTCDKSETIGYNQILKRNSDDQYFRIVTRGKDFQTPKVSTMNFQQLNVEFFEIS